MTSQAQRMLTIKQLLQIVPLSRATLWRMQREGTFPKSHAIGGRVVWYEDEIAEWQEKLRTSAIGKGKQPP